MFGNSLGALLAGLAGLGLICVGLFAIAMPGISASQYGLPTNDPIALTFVRAMGARDVILGLILEILLSSRAWESLSWTVLASSLLAFTDLACVVSRRRAIGAAAKGSSRGHATARSVLLHAMGGLGLVAIGILLRLGR